jgi:glycerol-3-phosphate dehydrogenase
VEREPARPGDRAATLERLGSETFDLLVIGAGIVGARVAYEAARSGAAVALLDAGDFGGATSSASSKLVHGGLRYLPMGDVRLIRESHLERRALLDRVAPHLVRPLAFLLPVYGGPHRALAIGAGLFTYSLLSGFRHSRARMVGTEHARRLVPPLRTDGMRGAGLYEDAQTHDSRLTLATVAAAARAGAAVANHLAVTDLEQAGGSIVAGRAGDVRVRCRAVVNAAGPWVDEVRRLEDPAARPLARLSKGVHVTMRQDEPWAAALTVPVDRGRVAFAVPWEGTLLLGTTDTEYEGDPAAARPEPEDVDTVLREAAVGLPPELLARDRIRYAFAGLRVLPRGRGDTATTPRDEVVHVGPAGMVSVAGGKLTTHRRIAVNVLRRLDAFARASISSDPLPGAGSLPERPAHVDPATWDHLTHLYGDEAAHVAAAGAEPVHPDGPDVWGQVHHAVAREWARTVEDVVRRRTTLAVRGLATPEVRDAIAATFARRGVFNSVDGR